MRGTIREETKALHNGWGDDRDETSDWRHVRGRQQQQQSIQIRTGYYVKTRRGDPYCIPDRVLATLDLLQTKLAPLRHLGSLSTCAPPSLSPSEPLRSGPEVF